MTDEPTEHVIDGDAVEEEVLDGLPVLAEVRPMEPEPAGGPASPDAPVFSAALPAVQAVAAAATGFVAGAATFALVRRHGARKLARAAQHGLARRQFDGLPIANSRTYLVRVHLIPKPGE
jgi:hypothetical protein